MKRWKGIFFLCLLAILLAAGCRKEMSAEEYLDLGKKYLLEQKYEEAIVAFTKVIEIDEKATEAYLGLAEAYAWTQDYEKAVDTLKQGHERTMDSAILAMQEGYEKYLEYPEAFQELARLLEELEGEEDPFRLWVYMRGEEYQTLISGLPVVLPYGNGAQEGEDKKPFLLYPCGHCYYGSFTMGERSGYGMWVSLDYEEGFFDFYQGQWEQDYPNGEGIYLVTDLWESEGEFFYHGGFKNGIFEKAEGDTILEGVLHAMKDVDDDRVWESREMPEEGFREQEDYEDYEEWENGQEEADVRNQGERTTGRIHLVSDKIEGGVGGFYVPPNDYSYQYNPEKQYFLALMEYAKGADCVEKIFDKDGNVIASGYEDALWMTENGYARIKYCYGDTEQEAEYRINPETFYTDVYSVAMGEIDGCAYVELFDWSGNLIESKKLSDGDDRNWYIEAPDIYPPEEFAYENAEVICEPSENELIIYDLEGGEIGRIMTENAAELTTEVIGNLLELRRGEYGACVGIYWIEEE